MQMQDLAPIAISKLQLVLNSLPLNEEAQIAWKPPGRFPHYVDATRFLSCCCRCCLTADATRVP